MGGGDWWRPGGGGWRLVVTGGGWWSLVVTGGGWWSLLLGAEKFNGTTFPKVPVRVSGSKLEHFPHVDSKSPDITGVDFFFVFEDFISQPCNGLPGSVWPFNSCGSRNELVVSLRESEIGDFQVEILGDQYISGC